MVGIQEKFTYSYRGTLCHAQFHNNQLFLRGILYVMQCTRHIHTYNIYIYICTYIILRTGTRSIYSKLLCSICTRVFDIYLFFIFFFFFCKWLSLLIGRCPLALLAVVYFPSPFVHPLTTAYTPRFLTRPTIARTALYNNNNNIPYPRPL
jgi:hypothetical protein